MLKSFLGATLQAEMEAVLTGEQRSKGNKRNGNGSKTIKSSTGSFQIDTPQDRHSGFEPKLIKAATHPARQPWGKDQYPVWAGHEHELARHQRTHQKNCTIRTSRMRYFRWSPIVQSLSNRNGITFPWEPYIALFGAWPCSNCPLPLGTFYSWVWAENHLEASPQMI